MIICTIQVIIMQNKIQEQAVEIIEQKTSLLKRIFIILFMIAFVSGGIFFFHEYKNGKFSNLETFQEYIFPKILRLQELRLHRKQLRENLHICSSGRLKF